MRRFITYAMVILLTGSATLVAQKATTPELLDKAMKRIPPAQGAMGKAIQSGAYADARKQLDLIEAALRDAHNFWVVNKKNDAIKMSDDSISKAQALGKLLAAPAPDKQAVQGAFKTFVGTCAACHTQFRAQDANQQYIIKPGSI